VAKKRTGLSQTLFDGIDPYGKGVGEPASAGEQSDQTGRLLSLPLGIVRPDPEQPRRLLPANLQSALAEQGKYDPVIIMKSWLAQAPKGDAKLGDLRKLADSISRHGLINPISVRPLDPPLSDGTQYLIITGERRYWAHVLLAAEGRQIQIGEQADPGQVQALLAPDGISIRAHQLIENIVREDINAVEKAHGMVALRYELSGVNPGSPPSPAKELSTSELISWTEVSNALDISKRYRIYVTSVLDLSDDAQAIVTEYNLAEKTIRPIVQKLKKYPTLQVEALQQLVGWQRENDSEEGVDRAVNNKSVTALVNRLLVRENRPMSQPRIQTAPNTQIFSSNVSRTIRFLKELKQEDLVLVARDLALDQTYKGTVEELQDLQTKIDQILQQVDTYRSDD